VSREDGWEWEKKRKEKRSRVMKDRITQKQFKNIILLLYGCTRHRFSFSSYLNYLTIDYKL